jgi:hypothetical protein
VTSTADSGPGSLREAIENANAMPGADSITFAISGTITLVSALPPITDPAGLSIDGGAQSITVSGNNAVRPFQTAAGALMELRRLTVTAGRATTGAGIVNSGGTLIIADSTISGNVAGFGSGGGGLLNESGTVTISNSAISGNGTLYAGNGGGIINKGTLTISTSRISGNATFTFGSSQGGGIVNEGMLTITDSAVSENRANGDSAGGGSHTTGGGIVNSGILFITRSTISGNRAGSGGGIANSLAGTLTISNSTISGNVAAGGCFRAFCSPGAGGGISGGNVAIASSTISANSASGSGGGLSGTATLANSILAANTAAVGPDCSGSLSPAAPNLVGDPAGCTIPGRPPLTGDARLGPLQDNGGPTDTHALLPDSPAIDAGDPNGCTDPDGNPLTIDQRGHPRPVDGDGDGAAVCDLGAFELDPLASGSTHPVLSLPGNLIIDASGPAIVTFNATATDAVDGELPVVCQPSSGSTFPIGTTTVTCTATDSDLNTTTGSFTVTVMNLTEMVSDLIETVAALNFQQGVNLLQNALGSFHSDNWNAACRQVGAFINQVHAQSGKSLDAVQANQLVLSATNVQRALGCR